MGSIESQLPGEWVVGARRPCHLDRSGDSSNRFVFALQRAQVRTVYYYITLLCIVSFLQYSNTTQPLLLLPLTMSDLFSAISRIWKTPPSDSGRREEQPEEAAVPPLPTPLHSRHYSLSVPTLQHFGGPTRSTTSSTHTDTTTIPNIHRVWKDCLEYYSYLSLYEEDAYASHRYAQYAHDVLEQHMVQHEEEDDPTHEDWYKRTYLTACWRDVNAICTTTNNTNNSNSNTDFAQISASDLTYDDWMQLAQVWQTTQQVVLVDENDNDDTAHPTHTHNYQRLQDYFTFFAQMAQYETRKQPTSNLNTLWKQYTNNNTSIPKSKTQRQNILRNVYETWKQQARILLLQWSEAYLTTPTLIQLGYGIIIVNQQTSSTHPQTQPNTTTTTTEEPDISSMEEEDNDNNNNISMPPKPTHPDRPLPAKSPRQRRRLWNANTTNDDNEFPNHHESDDDETEDEQHAMPQTQPLNITRNDSPSPRKKARMTTQHLIASVQEQLIVDATTTEEQQHVVQEKKQAYIANFDSSDEDKEEEDEAPPPRRTTSTNVLTPSTSPHVLSMAQRKKGKPFTTLETNAIVLGLRQFGIGRWKDIKEAYPIELAERSSGQIKDRYRTLVKQGVLHENGTIVA